MLQVVRVRRYTLFEAILPVLQDNDSNKPQLSPLY